MSATSVLVEGPKTDPAVAGHNTNTTYTDSTRNCDHKRGRCEPGYFSTLLNGALRGFISIYNLRVSYEYKFEAPA